MKRHEKQVPVQISLTEGQLKLLDHQGYLPLDDRELQSLKRAHQRYLDGATFRPHAPRPGLGISFDEAKKRVAKYLEAL
jgi:hypothetical protein